MNVKEKHLPKEAVLPLTKQLNPTQGKKPIFLLLAQKARTSPFKHMDKDAATNQGKCNSDI